MHYWVKFQVVCRSFAYSSSLSVSFKFPAEKNVNFMFAANYTAAIAGFKVYIGVGYIMCTRRGAQSAPPGNFAWLRAWMWCWGRRMLISERLVSSNHKHDERNAISSFSLSLLDKKLSAINILFKSVILYLKPTRCLVCIRYTLKHSTPFLEKSTGFTVLFSNRPSIYSFWDIVGFWEK